MEHLHRGLMEIPVPAKVVLIIFCVVLAIVVLGAAIGFCRSLARWLEEEEERLKAKSTEMDDTSSQGASLTSEKSLTSERSIRSRTQIFTYAQVVKITNGFEKVIGRGGYAIVYGGSLRDGTRVAVKVLRSSIYSPKAFQNEVELLMRIHHKNLVSLIGYCNEGKNMVLIYEYMSQGNLKEMLSVSSDKVLSWRERLQIALSAAQGLEYLHNGCKPLVVHRDLKTANILLNEKLEAKISDFGISRIMATDAQTHATTGVIGTFGYLDPEYAITCRLTEKSDVYSFGVILFELMTGQPAIIKSNSESTHIVYWAQSKLEEADIFGVMDPKLRGEFDIVSARKVFETAKACVPLTGILRRTMSDVLNQLKESLALVTTLETSGMTRESSMDGFEHHLPLGHGEDIASEMGHATW